VDLQATTLGTRLGVTPCINNAAEHPQTAHRSGGDWEFESSDEHLTQEGGQILCEILVCLLG
jgi:hypothetical protein